MLDNDFARLYQVETKRINEVLKNNPDKFPERFSFLLEEIEIKNFDLKNKRGKRRYNYRAFTEQGIVMLATILKSKITIRKFFPTFFDK